MGPDGRATGEFKSPAVYESAVIGAQSRVPGEEDVVYFVVTAPGLPLRSSSVLPIRSHRSKRATKTRLRGQASPDRGRGCSASRSAKNSAANGQEFDWLVTQQGITRKRGLFEND